MATFTFVASATASAASITIPASAQAGDFAVWMDTARNATSNTIPTQVVPSGWTPADANITRSGSNSATRSIIAHKILESGDPGASLTGMNDQAELKIVLVFRPSEVIGSVVPSTPTGEATLSNPASQLIDMSPASVPAIGIARFAATGTVSPRTVSPAMDAEVGATTSWAQYVIYNSSPADHTIDMDDEGDNVLQGIYYTFTFPDTLFAQSVM